MASNTPVRQFAWSASLADGRIAICLPFKLWLDAGKTSGDQLRWEVA
jgi:hypothetical protein